MTPLGVHLCEMAERWFAEVCVRRICRDLWAEQFGKQVAYPEALKPYLEPVKLTLEQRNFILWSLRLERKAGLEPPPFEEMVAAYMAGEEPQDVRKSPMTQEEWEARVPARYL